MASRVSPKYKVMGSPLAGVLREQSQMIRSTTRRSVAVPGPAGPAGAAGVASDSANGAVATAKVTTDAMGVATWTYTGNALASVPVISATPVSTLPAIVTLTNVTATSVTVNTWRPDGTAYAARTVHLVAHL